MNTVFLDMLKQLVDDAGDLIWKVLKPLKTAVKWIGESISWSTALALGFIFWCTVAVALVGLLLPGCAPLAYMAYKQPAEEVPVVVEERDEAKEFFMMLFESGCDPEWALLQKSKIGNYSDKTTIAGGCHEKERQELLPDLLGR